MKALPSPEELAALAVALRLTLQTQPLVEAPVTSSWAQNARREGVRADMPQTWRG